MPAELVQMAALCTVLVLALVLMPAELVLIFAALFKS